MQQDERRSYHDDDADAKQLAFLRGLMGDNVTLERAHYEIHKRHFAGRAAASTVEALMLGLRARGIAALKEAPVRRRLSELSEQQLHEVCARLQRLKPEIAKAWSGDEVRLLIKAWAACHGR
jgi:hypothetical protein